MAKIKGIKGPNEYHSVLQYLSLNLCFPTVHTRSPAFCVVHCPIACLWKVLEGTCFTRSSTWAWFHFYIFYSYSPKPLLLTSAMVPGEKLGKKLRTAEICWICWEMLRETQRETHETLNDSEFVESFQSFGNLLISVDSANIIYIHIYIYNNE